MKNKYKLIATDFDGTLINDVGKVSKRNQDILFKYKEKGYQVVAVTGRTLGAVKDVIDIKAFTHLILNNGAYIYEVETKKILYKKTIEKIKVKEITKLVEQESYKIDYCSMTTYYRYKRKKQNPKEFIVNIESLDQIKEEIAKINITLQKNEHIEEISKEIARKYDMTSFVMQDSNANNPHISVSPKGIDKKETLEKLGNNLQIAKEEMLFFGDGLNDLEIIEWVGCGIAMENAFDIVKEKAKEITASNNEDGVALFLENLECDIDK